MTMKKLGIMNYLDKALLRLILTSIFVQLLIFITTHLICNFYDSKEQHILETVIKDKLYARSPVNRNCIYCKGIRTPHTILQKRYPEYDNKLHPVVSIHFWKSEKYKVLLCCHCSQVHSDVKW